MISAVMLIETKLLMFIINVKYIKLIFGLQYAYKLEQEYYIQMTLQCVV